MKIIFSFRIVLNLFNISLSSFLFASVQDGVLAAAARQIVTTMVIASRSSILPLGILVLIALKLVRVIFLVWLQMYSRTDARELSEMLFNGISSDATFSLVSPS